MPTKTDLYVIIGIIAIIIVLYTAGFLNNSQNITVTMVFALLVVAILMFYNLEERKPEMIKVVRENVKETL